MISGAWRERLAWWVPPLVLLVLNLIALGWFQAVYSGVARNVDRQLERRTIELEAAKKAVERQRAVVERVRENQEEVARFYDTRLATSQERLTDILREVRRLAATAGLAPSSISYPEDELAEFGLEKRGINFGVEGTYVALRRFVNLLEMSDSFLTLEEVTLSGRGANRLRISLRLSTLFSTRQPSEEIEEAAS